jgi:DNA (cytosine-5)-methyltransferase 1
MDIKNYTIVDLFSGIGGLSLGFKEHGFKNIFSSDFDQGVSETFQHNFPDVNFSKEDIKDLTEERLKEIVKNEKINVVMAGIPCQSFSMAGYRIRNDVDASDDPRHFLYKEFMRVVKILNPDVVLIENVKGILSIKKGEIKDLIMKELENLGYNVDCRVLNSADYGVPQTRERVIFIGNKFGLKNIFPKGTHNPQNYVGVGTVLKDIKGSNHEPRFLTGDTLKRVKLIKPGENWTSLPKDLQTKSRHSGAFGRLDPDKPSRTLLTRADTPTVGYVTHPTEHRTLTVRESARIQGFPDDFEFKGSKSSQYKQVGNAVPVGLSRALASEIKSLLMRIHEQE